MELGMSCAPEPGGKYRHMMYHDRLVWDRVLADPPREIIRCWYDVKVGSGAALEEAADEVEMAIVAGTLCKRIDAVCAGAGIVWICEVKPYGNHAALGQALVYRDLFRAEYTGQAESCGVIACGRADEDVARIAESYGLEVWTVGEVYSRGHELAGSEMGEWDYR